MVPKTSHIGHRDLSQSCDLESFSLKTLILGLFWYSLESSPPVLACFRKTKKRRNRKSKKQNNTNVLSYQKINSVKGVPIKVEN